MKILVSCALAIVIGGWARVGAQTSSQPPAVERSTYVLGPGDQIVIRALHAEEISDKPFRIEPDGTLNLPLIGRVQAAGKTLAGLETDLRTRLGAYYLQPQVTVTVTDLRSQPVSVLGSVANPGVQQLDGRKTLLQVISAAGGLKPDAGQVVRITRRMEWGRIPLPTAHDDPGGQFSIAEVNLHNLLDSRDPSQNIEIRPEDVITVPQGSIVYVIGEVKKPGGFVIGARSNITVLEALSMAEGLGTRASPGHARILRPPEGQDGGSRTEVAVNLTRILAGKDPDVALKPADILLVPNSTAKSASIRSIEAAIQIGTGLAIWH